MGLQCPMNEGTDPGVEEDSGVCGEGLTLGVLLSESKGKGARWKKYTRTYVYIYKVSSHGGQSGFLKMNMGSCHFFLYSETLSGFPST